MKLFPEQSDLIIVSRFNRRIQWLFPVFIVLLMLFVSGLIAIEHSIRLKQPVRHQHPLIRQSKTAMADSHKVKILLILPNKLGANYNYYLDNMAAYGWDITTAGVDSFVNPCSWAAGLSVNARSTDTLVSEITDVRNWDVVAVMVGSWQDGTPNPYGDLLNSSSALALIDSAVSNGLPVWSSCVGMRVLAAADVLNGVSITGRSAYANEYIAAGANYLGENLLPVIDQNIITATKGMWYQFENIQAISSAIEMLSLGENPARQKSNWTARTGYAESGETLWSKLYDGGYSEGGRAICSSANGDFIVAGYTFSQGNGQSDVLLMKTDSLGNQRWIRTFGGGGWEYANDVITTSDNGFLITGYTSSSGAGEKDIYAVRTDSNGNIIWQKTYGGVKLDVGQSACETPDGYFLIAGYTQSYGAGKSDIYFLKVNASGDTLWTKTYGGAEAELAAKIMMAHDGNYIILGSSGSTGSAGKSDFNLIKTNTNGVEIWNKKYGTADYQAAIDAVETADNGFVIVGHTDVHGSELMDIYLVRTDSAGNKKWTKRIESSNDYYDCGKAICERADGTLMIVGQSKSPSTRKNDAFMVLTDANGNTLWSRIIVSSPTDLITGCVPASNGCFVILGQTEYTAKGNHDVWLFKISDPSGVSIDPMNELTPREFRLYQNYPNPFNPVTTIRYEIKNNSAIRIDLYNVSGQKVRTLVNRVQQTGTHNVVWDGKNDDGHHVGSGIYFCRLVCGNRSETMKMTLIK